ncbi:MAG: hypothetical protein KDD62_02210 [Bdellovibrionales bacterium]|nr:hypothetical protein [Bdellovibrionales bacterium]
MNNVFIRNIIDYAGLFPPAQLPLTEAFSHFQNYHTGAHSALLGSFIAPVPQLESLVKILDLATPLPVSIITTSVEADSKLISASLNLAKDALQPSSFETKFRHEDNFQFVKSSLKGAHNIAPDAFVFFELGLSENWELELEEYLSLISGKPLAAFKLRCGGTQLPSPLEAAQAITTCSRLGIPMKFTAGLHHAVRSGKTHGFLNMFFAAIAAFELELSLDEVLLIIENEETETLKLNDHGIEWAGHQLTITQIDHARQHSVFSFGCCSFDEPIQDLIQLGWLNE